MSRTNATAPCSDQKMTFSGCPHHAVVERRDGRADVFVGVGVFPGESRGNRRQLGAGLADRDAIGEPSDEHAVANFAPLVPQRGRQKRVRHPNLGVERKLESVAHDADDRDGDAVNTDRAANRRWVGAVAGLPHRVADDRDRRASLPVVVGSECTAEHRFLADDGEQVRRCVGPGKGVGRMVFVADGERGAEDRGERLERVARFLPVLAVFQRGRSITAAGVAGPEGHDAVGAIEGKSAKNHRVDDSEDGVVSADAERQGGDGGQREPLVLHEQPDRETKVLPEPRH
jgi:hypothetical protein